MRRLEVGIVGTGYVGLVTGACLAHLGHSVVCVDIDREKVESLSRGEVPIYEPGLEEVVGGALRQERISFTTDLPATVERVDVLFIAVSTPPGEDGAADLSNVASVAREIGASLARRGEKSPLVVVNKSTVPVGSGDYVSMLIEEGAEGRDVSYYVVSNPEFLREGSAVYDTLFPDRIVIGTDSREASEAMRELYAPIIEQSFPTSYDPRPKAAVPFIVTDLASAEMIKYAANAFLATKISFINEVAAICDLVGADVTNVAHGIGLDSRIGSRFLSAGIGWGGSCFPKDVSALRSIAREYDYESTILDAVVAVNDRQLKQVVSKLQRELHTLKGKRVALLGLTFKPNTDDMREAPSLKIARTLDSLGARVVGYDPVATGPASEAVPQMKVVTDPYAALSGAHAAVVVTEWDEVRNLDPKQVAGLMAAPKLVVDGRNVLDPASVEERGLLYRGFGRG
ncbi:NDP-sugDHase: nucleotide sugar dehydrogenase [Rubrobacter radiotolerans]|uniref:UDP-glucose 6-dehydrogenase n=1 Tax=Rubrobacter radiotolerans TaxID=42256 RepID=A0A023X077_RUBRA|nr:UDP-glucose/GDP-mannose dehydrogenase family protein [Rubrobacter radiotolerans]AHY45743.1 NDP-sugDHase: nucleotide sugar dehydrogenase [Rubrobacter radiotolerans]